MSIEPKPFQQATIDAALGVFNTSTGYRRFLVADEVGLGKTVVASEIIRRMSEGRTEPLRVFYVCSNLAIAAQNLSRLVSFLPNDERDSAIASVDRPSLMPTRDPPAHHGVQVFSLTPDTALPLRGGRRREGRMEERALGIALLEELLPTKIPRLYRTLRVNAGVRRFGHLVRHYRKEIKYGRITNHSFRMVFRSALRFELGLKPRQHLPTGIRTFLEKKSGGLDLVAAIRSGLAVAALQQVQPDIVILDEFQRFRDLLDESSEVGDRSNPASSDDAEASRVLQAIRGNGVDHQPALLLLSATPYTPYRGRRDATSYGDSAKDFFKLISFLYGGDQIGCKVAKRTATLFEVVGEELRKGMPLSKRAKSARDELSSTLTKVMSRTERLQLSLPNYSQSDNGGICEATLLPEDVSVFRHLTKCFRPDDHSWSVPFWQSVPLPMQSLGSRYKAWKNAESIEPPPDTTLTPSMRLHFDTIGEWPHPRLRALLSEMSPQQLQLPWIAPSIPWWSLDDGWKSSKSKSSLQGKLLVFSRFRAVPVALSGLISYTLESRLLGQNRSTKTLGYEEVTHNQHLAAHPERPSLLVLFHPSPILAGLDPLMRKASTVDSAKAAIRRQLSMLLRDLGISFVRRVEHRPRKPWQLLAMIERRAKVWDKSKLAWEAVVFDQQQSPGEVAGTRLQAMIQRWEAEGLEALTEIDIERELKPLIALALDAPGVVMARALKRHWPEAFDDENFHHLTRLCWRGLRAYFDSPWFVAALTKEKKQQFPDAIRRAVIAGNLESVLDEHFWYLSATSSGNWKRSIFTLETSLRLRTSNVVFHQHGPDTPPMRLRCHSVVPLNEARATQTSGAGVDAARETADIPWRPEEVRNAFNAPFWPHMLVTTSIGQEGLDFHPWCRSLAHWDLCSGPVALEQREGRIARFAGLSIRRAIVEHLGQRDFSSRSNESPWTRLASLAERELSDETGLSPWWIASGATTDNLVFTIPGSEQSARLAHLHRERALYRLVIGIPEQTDLLDLIAAREEWDTDMIRQACLDLSAFNQSNQRHIRNGGSS